MVKGNNNKNSKQNKLKFNYLFQHPIQRFTNLNLIQNSTIFLFILLALFLFSLNVGFCSGDTIVMVFKCWLNGGKPIQEFINSNEM